jgi:UDP-glucose 4-epimerase
LISAERRNLRGARVLVTGAAGFIGSHLVDLLLQQDPSRVIAVDNLFLGKPENLADAGRVAGDTLSREWIDVADEEAFHKLLRSERPDVVFDLAVIPLLSSLEQPRWTFDQNIRMTLSVCEGLRLGLYRTLVHFSSSEAYGTAQQVPMNESHPLRPCTPYAASKAASDHLVMSYVATFGSDAIIVRPFNNYGPRQNDSGYAGLIPIVIRRLLAGQAPEIQGDGNQTRDFTFVRDTVESAIALYSRARSGTVVNDVIALLGELTGVDVAPQHVSPRPGDIARHVATAELLLTLTGFVPRTTLRDGLRETVIWYRSRAGAPTAP